MKRLHALLLVCVLVATPTAVRAQDFLGKPLTKWTAELNDNDARVRRGAAFALSKFSNQTDRVVPLLLKRIAQDQDAGVRDAAATSLGDMIQAMKSGRGGHWSDAEPVLRRALEQEEDEQALRGALYAVGSFGPDGAALLPAVQGKLTSKKSACVRQNAAWALGRMGEKAGDAVEPLIERLTDEDSLVRRDAATALGDLGLPLAKPAIRPLLALVSKESDEVVKKTALEKLINLVGPENKDSVEPLLALLNDDDVETARLAAFVLAKIGGMEATPAVKVLRGALKDEEPQIQSLAAASLGNLGPLAAPAVRELGQVLRESTDTATRRNCAIALGHVGPDAKPALGDLVAVLNSDAPIEVRHFTIEALARMRSPANDEAVPDILKVLANKGPDKGPPDERYNLSSIRQRCIWCFFTVEKLPKEAVPVLTAILDENDDASLMVRYDAARVLAMYLREEAPDKAADWLLHMLKNERLLIYNRTDARASGGGESSSGNSTVKADVGGDARFMAAQALGYMGKKASGRAEIVEALKKATEAKDERLRDKAKEALTNFGL